MQQVKVELASQEPVRVRAAKTRKRAIAAWKVIQEPLAYGERGSATDTATMAALLKAILVGGAAMRAGLPLATRKTISYTEFAQRLYNIGIWKEAIKAPVIKKSAFQAILPIAIQYMTRYCSVQRQSTFITDIFSDISRRMRIHFIPWSNAKPGQQGRPSEQPTITQWVTLCREPEDARPQRVSHVRSVVEDSLVGSLATSASDRNAGWTCLESLSKLGNLKPKAELPEEWGLQNASLSALDEFAYVSDTYQYVQDTYNGGTWWHRMALLWAIMFSKVVPNIFFDKEEIKAIQNGPDHSTEITSKIRALSWVSTEAARKGNTEPIPFVTMMSTYIIAMLDRKSPLRRYAASNADSMGKGWTKKHSTSINEGC